MSGLLDRDARVTSSPERPALPASPISTGLLAALQAAGASLTVVLLPVVLTWASAAYSTAPWSRALQLGIDTWLLAHHTGIVIPGGHLGLVPLGLLLVPLFTSWLAGVRLARTLDPAAEAIRSGVGRAEPTFPPSRALVAMAGGYAALAALACGIGATGEVRPLAAQAVVGALVISAIGGVTGAATWAARGRLDGLRLLVDRFRLPAPIRSCLRPASMILGVQLLLGLVLLVVAGIHGHDQVLLLHRSLAPGLIGGLVLGLAQLVALPNTMIWAFSYASGPGFAIGAGTAVRPGEVRLGALPAVPLLGALPDAALPAAAVGLLPVLVALTAVVAGRRLLTRQLLSGHGSWWRALRDVVLVAVLVGLGWLLLGWLAGGAAGPGRLAVTGPSPWLLAATAGAEVTAGLLVTLATGYLWAYLRAPSPPG